jgi:hypothetical protein
MRDYPGLVNVPVEQVQEEREDRQKITPQRVIGTDEARWRISDNKKSR